MPSVIGQTTRVGLICWSGPVRLLAQVRPPSFSQLKSQRTHYLAARPGRAESCAICISRRDERESAGDFCLAREPGESRKQRACIGLEQSIIFDFGV